MSNKSDYLVIGSGPAGHVSAIRAAQLGLKVAVVEKEEGMFGGVCLNEGCIPAKSLYRSAKIYDLVKRSPELCGLDIKSGLINMSAIVKKSREHAEALRKGLSFLFGKNGIELIKGKASFLDKNTVEIELSAGGKQVVTASNFLIATGSTPRALPGIPFDGKTVLDSSHGIRLGKVPSNILIVGGGAIGTEFASFFNLVGADVTLVEVEENLLPTEDKEIAKRLESVFLRKGIKVFLSSRVKKVMPGSGMAEAIIEGPHGEFLGRFETVLLSVGRTPSTAGLGLEKAGIKTDDKGFIPVDGAMRTTVPNIYAAGDVVRTPMLAHVASAEGELAAEAAAGHTPGPIDYSSVPNAMYGSIQVASVGLTEETVSSSGIPYKTGKQFFKANGRAVVNSETEGFIKVIADEKSRKLIGAHIIGYEAAELIHEFVVAKKAGLTVDDIARTIHAHPTFSETAQDACLAVFGKAIHG